MRCSVDLHQRVVDFVRSGGSKAEAARRFKVGEASVYRWLKPGEGWRTSVLARKGLVHWIGKRCAVM